MTPEKETLLRARAAVKEIVPGFAKEIDAGEWDSEHAIQAIVAYEAHRNEPLPFDPDLIGRLTIERGSSQ